MEDIKTPVVDIVPPKEETINVFDPENNPENIPASQLAKAQSLGYRVASPEEVHAYKQEQKYGTPGQIAVGAIEAAGKTATSGFSTGLAEGMRNVARKAGVPEDKLDYIAPTKEDIEGREEQLPVAVQIPSEIVGIVANPLLGAVGKVAGNVIKGTGAIAKVGSLAVRGAADTAVYQGGDENHKMFLGDPNQTLGTAMLEIGKAGALGGLLGGGIGVVSPLWKETVGKKMGGFLEAVKRRANGEAISLTPELEAALGKSGMEIAPEIRVALSENPELVNQWRKLQESTTSPGLRAQESLKNFRQSASDNLVTSFGKSIDDIPSLSGISEHEAGSAIQKQVIDSLEKKLSPLTDQFEAIKQQFSKVPIGNDIRSKLQQDLAEIAQKEGYGLSAGSPQNKVVQGAIKDVMNVKSLEDLRKLRSIIGNNTFDVLNTKGLNHTGSLIKKAFNEIEESVVEAAAGSKSPALLGEVRAARGSYKQAMDTLDTLNDRLHVGSYGGGKSFVNALKEMKPEDVLRRLNPKSDAGLLDVLAKDFPEIASAIKEHNINKLLAQAAVKSPEGHSINAKNLFNAIDKMSPELRAQLLSPGAEAKIRGTQALLKALPERMNPSGTAKTLDALNNRSLGSAAAMVGALFGHGIKGTLEHTGMGYILGQMARLLGRDVPDAIRYSFLKFLGHSGPVEPAAFKSMVDYASAMIKGEATLSKGVKNLFRAGQTILPTLDLPTEKDLGKLDKRIQSLNADPSQLLDLGGEARYYLPDHGQEMATTAARAIQYLGGLRPSEDKAGILDEPRIPSTAEKARYTDALVIADAPMSILQSVKDGTITQNDIIDLRSIHPGLYERMSTKILGEMTDYLAKGNNIPYKQRFSLSMFLGMPLDSSMTPQAIQANQMTQQVQPSPEQTTEAPRQKGSKQALNKFSVPYQTGTQARSLQRMKA